MNKEIRNKIEKLIKEQFNLDVDIMIVDFKQAKEISLETWNELGKPMVLVQEPLYDVMPFEYLVFSDYGYGYTILIDLDEENITCTKTGIISYKDYIIIPENFDGEFKVAKILYKERR